MDLSSIKPDKTLDTRGLTCPMPTLKTKKELKGLKANQTLEVIGDDPGSKNDLPDFANKGANEFLGMVDDPEGYTRYYIRKG